jgi:RNase P subunit RPR2
MKSIPCDLCYSNIVKGNIFKAQIKGFTRLVVVCEACRRAIMDARKEYFNGEI